MSQAIAWLATAPALPVAAVLLAENLSFGFLWLAVIAVYPASWLGMSLYLALNLFFGTLTPGYEAGFGRLPEA